MAATEMFLRGYAGEAVCLQRGINIASVVRQGVLVIAEMKTSSLTRKKSGQTAEWGNV